MRIQTILSLYEALKPSQYRDIVKNWDKTYLEKVFKNSPHKKDRNAYRLYIPISATDNIVIEPNPRIKDYLDSNDFEIGDYVKGYVKKKSDGRTMKIGKVLPDELKQVFVNDPKRRASKHETMVVISRHPYDIAGMSTDRGVD